MRDRHDNVVAVMDACNGKLSKLKNYADLRISDKIKALLRRFVVAHQFKLTETAADDLDLSVVRYVDGREAYLEASELKKLFKSRLENLNITVNSFKARHLKIAAGSKGLFLNLSRAEVSKLVIEDRCNMILDLRDNLFMKMLVVKDAFSGNINMSRNNLEKIVFGNNNRADITVNNSLKCFNLDIGDVFSGNMNIKGSCFHKFKFGYYCYGTIHLEENWGNKDIFIGNSFRGSLSVDTVHVHNIHIGQDCKGKILIKSKNNRQGSRFLDIASEFNGLLDMSDSQTIREVEVGASSGGNLRMLGCPSIKVLRIDEHFNGLADLSDSAVEYVSAGKDCNGQIVLLNCDNLSLVRLPNERKSSLTIEKNPLDVRKDAKKICYRFKEGQSEDDYCQPGFWQRIKNLKKVFKRQISAG